MRERTLPVDTAKLNALSELYRPKTVADKIGISKQRWRNYETGKNDVPESIIDRLCLEFNLNKSDLVLVP